MDIVRLDDCLCFRCGQPVRELFKLRTANTAYQRSVAKLKFDKNVVTLDHKGKNIYRHGRRCVK
jgi:hypothetical protein